MSVPVIEPKVFTEAYNAVITSYPDIDMQSKPIFKDVGDIAVRLYEMDSSTYSRTSDCSGNVEHYADLSYELQIRSNNVDGNKAQAEAVYNIINSVLLGIGFLRTSKKPFFEDTTYRIAARYRGRLDEIGNIS